MRTTISEYTYHDTITWYNSERRENYGGYINYGTNHGDRGFHNEGASIQEFHLNLTGHTSSDNELITTITTYANNVKLKLRCYLPDPTDLTSIQSSSFLEYIDGTIEPLNGSGLPKNFGTQHDSVSDMTVYYCPSYVRYNTDNQSTATQLNPFGAYFIRVDTPSPYLTNYKLL